ncbi:MAG: glycoside hydrolase family 127 protein [Limisphaerales bacterium]
MWTSAVCIALSTFAAKQSELVAVPFTDVQIDSEFWAPRIKLNRQIIVPHDLKFCEGRINNFAKAAGIMPGKFEGTFFDDSDVYKVIEGAAYSLSQQRDPELENTIDAVIDKIAAAQQSDGYLYTFYTVNKELDKRWTKEKDMHETYCAGHLIEGAIAYYQATGKRKLLDVAIRVADHIDTVFGPDKKHDVPGHEEIELALVKLWRVTKNDKYLKLAEFFIAERGHNCKRQLYGEYCQDHVPIEDQREIQGHAVRAMYLYSAVADIAAITHDPKYIATLDAIWNDVTQRKMYLTGGIGPSAKNEGFTVAYDLPNESAYCETCASIGMAFWNQRMALLHADAKYADIVERVLYNGALSGVSLDGDKFFYVNPLESLGKHHRQPWFGCACCPVNVVRFLPTIGGYLYAHDDKRILVNQYAASRAHMNVGSSEISLKQETKYPWDGAVKFTIEPQRKSKFTLALRIPNWCGNSSTNDLYQFEDKAQPITILVNGKSTKANIESGYATIDRKWKSGDVVQLNLPMPVRHVKAIDKVAADRGRVAIQRGPVVYCFEGDDNDDRARTLILSSNDSLTPEYRPSLLGGVTILRGRARAIPYFAWDNRDDGDMEVWLKSQPKN